MPVPDFLVIGHVTKDLVGAGQFRLGGTATFAAITVRNLGLYSAIVTSAEADVASSPLLAGIAIARRPSPATSTFENIYYDGRRRQYIRAVAEPIRPIDIPPDWRTVPAVHIGPLAQEIEPEILDLFPSALIAVTPQGWMRQWDRDGLVHQVPWATAEAVLRRAQVLVYSEEDVNRDVEQIHAYGRLAQIMVVTQSRRGCTVYVRGQHPRHFPAFPAVEVDPTGAGDVFAAAFLIRLQQTGDPYDSARFANCVASFAVEAPGSTGLPTLEQVDRRMAAGHGYGKKLE